MKSLFAYSLKFARYSLIFACLLLLVTTLTHFFITEVVFAAITSSDYIIEKPNLNFSSGSMNSSNFKLGFTAGQTAPGPYSSVGYKLHAGFWQPTGIFPFGLSVSPTIIDFGSLTPGTPITKTLTLTVSAGGVTGYSVTVQENKPLTSTTANTIPDTLCDNSDCDEKSAGTWSKTTAYGFGYTMLGNDVPKPFPQTAPAGNNYKQYSNISSGEKPEPVMVSTRLGKNRSAIMVLKVNIPGVQAAGTYQNVITFIATPSY